MLTDETLGRMDIARHALPEPGDDVVGVLIKELRRQPRFLYSLGESVIVLGVNIAGKIDALKLTRGGCEYHVVFWIEGERKSEWLFGDEISGG